MGKVTIGKPKQTELGNELIKSLSEAVVAKEINFNIEETVKAHADAIMEKHRNTFEKLAQYEKQELLATMSPVSLQSCQCSPAHKLQDKRVRSYLISLRKHNKKQHDFQLAKLNRIDKEAQEQNEKVSKFLSASKNASKELDKDMLATKQQLELIQEQLKVKSVHIKETKITERFDHRLVIFNLVLLFLNIILLMK